MINLFKKSDKVPYEAQDFQPDAIELENHEPPVSMHFAWFVIIAALLFLIGWASLTHVDKIVTADGGQLKSIKAGTGLIGTDYNGNSEQTWQLDWESVQAKINEAIATLNKKLMATIKANSYVTADNGEQVAIKARIIEIDGMKVPQFYPEIITETEEDE